MRLRNYLLLVTLLLASCAAPDTQHHIVISTRDQKLAVLDRGTLMATSPVSTLKFGLGDYLRSSRTPLGQLEVAKKIGDNAPVGAVFKDRVRTGEIGPANFPGGVPMLPVAIRSSRASFGCEDAKRKTKMRLAATSTFTAHRKNG